MWTPRLSLVPIVLINMLCLAVSFRLSGLKTLSSSLPSSVRKVRMSAEALPTLPAHAPLHVPTVGTGPEQSDVFSRLLSDRIVLLGSEVNDDVANTLVSQILYLATADPKADITLYINSPGGAVQAGLAIFDVMQYVPCDIATVCFGSASSMGAFLLAAGTKGKRKSLPNSRIMIHQPLGGTQGESSEVEIATRMILHTKEVLNTYLSAFTEQPLDRIRQDTERDFYMTPQEAQTYGLIDHIVQHKLMIPKPRIPDLRVPSVSPIYDSSVFQV